MFSDSSMTLDLFASEIGQIQGNGFDSDGIERLWQWYSEEVQHDVLFDPQSVVFDWVQYGSAVEAVRDLNRNLPKRDVIRHPNGKRITEADLRIMDEAYLTDRIRDMMIVLECGNGSILVCIADIF